MRCGLLGRARRSGATTYIQADAVGGSGAIRRLLRRRPSCPDRTRWRLFLRCAQRRIGSGKLSGQGTERYYFSGIARTTRKKPESYLVWYRDSNSGF